jgi:uncharacterized protein YegP (UPF0339 family)
MNEPRFEVYKRKVNAAGDEHKYGGYLGGFGWRSRAANGQITAIGGEGFTRREDAHRAVEDFRRELGEEDYAEWVPPDILDVDE